MTSAALAADGAPGPSNGPPLTEACTSNSASGLAPLPPVSVFTRLLDLPSFLLASLILYWSVALGVIMGYIRPWAGRKPRDDALGW